MITEDDGDLDPAELIRSGNVNGEGVDEDLLPLLTQISTLHSKKILGYKRLLEKTQLSSAAQLHALQAEVRMLRGQLDALGHGGGNKAITMGGRMDLELLMDGGLCSNCGKKKKGGSYWSGYRDAGFEDEEFHDIEGNDDELVKALKGLGRGPDGKWVFDETKVKRVLKKMGREARGRL